MSPAPARSQRHASDDFRKQPARLCQSREHHSGNRVHRRGKPQHDAQGRQRVQKLSPGVAGQRGALKWGAQVRAKSPQGRHSCTALLPVPTRLVPCQDRTRPGRDQRAILLREACPFRVQEGTRPPMPRAQATHADVPPQPGRAGVCSALPGDSGPAAQSAPTPAGLRPMGSGSLEAWARPRSCQPAQRAPPGGRRPHDWSPLWRRPPGQLACSVSLPFVQPPANL